MLETSQGVTQSILIKRILNKNKLCKINTEPKLIYTCIGEIRKAKAGNWKMYPCNYLMSAETSVGEHEIEVNL